MIILIILYIAYGVFGFGLMLYGLQKSDPVHAKDLFDLDFFLSFLVGLLGPIGFVFALIRLSVWRLPAGVIYRNPHK
jgi:hypothetical protein